MDVQESANLVGWRGITTKTGIHWVLLNRPLNYLPIPLVNLSDWRWMTSNFTDWDSRDLREPSAILFRSSKASWESWGPR